MRIKSLPQTEKVTVVASLLMIALLNYTYFFTKMKFLGYDHIFLLSILLWLNIGIRIFDTLRENRIIRRLVHLLMFVLSAIALFCLIWFFLLFSFIEEFSLWMPLAALSLYALLFYGTSISVIRYGSTEDD
ncbi:hypothetical protein R1T16_09535 [Flavobacterium sp. DG1-102-2]|uniref:hypothetical protein n=1 Tax=Flavobacterium sp. DG1-102-2 TaxID=3081663 RepID=UPI00294A738D|nr:hypothetical protein [Flavobacterium sp. DG1-102-2]MDV6168665.1 hypothetical protein [Flavobacterium sp. DG1-102-2]